jgi:L-ascorbate metabolism protein UlaG (beta-lactamase superfamily)
VTAIRVKNYKLPVIRAGWKGNLFEEGDRFVNEEFPSTPDFGDVVKWTFQRNPQRREKAHDPFRLKLVDDHSFLSGREDCIIWLGHASFYIRLNGIVMLIDPVFYDIPFVKRYVKHALSPTGVGHVDYLLISHDHRDHCQERSIREVVRNNPQIEILTGLQMDKLLKRWVPAASVQCAGWYQQFRTRPALAVCFLPTRHWGKRSYNDTNTRLWGAFTIQSSTTTIYFGGDTGFGSHFREASELFPRIDVAILGVGAYKPSWLMTPVHISPKEAVEACNELNAAMMIPMHYGTFDLSDEPPGEPVSALKELKERGVLKAQLKFLNPGEVLQLAKGDLADRGERVMPLDG